MQHACNTANQNDNQQISKIMSTQQFTPYPVYTLKSQEHCKHGRLVAQFALTQFDHQFLIRRFLTTQRSDRHMAVGENCFKAFSIAGSNSTG